MLTDALQRPARDLRISVTDRCNFRCGYCMPKDKYGRDHVFLPRSALLSFEEIEMIARIFIELGVTKIRLTGGEPLIRRDLEKLILSLSRLDGLQDLSLTTNASLLTKQRAQNLRSAGLSRINISLDALNKETFAKLNGIFFPVERVLENLEHACNAGFETVKVNMVVQKGVNESAILPMIDYFIKHNIILRFIEFMDVGNTNEWSLDDVFSAQNIRDLIQSRYEILPLDANYPGEVAKRWTLKNQDLEIGIISSVSTPFCNQCSRARLSALGELYTCLFTDKGFDLRQIVRQDSSLDGLRQRIKTIWGNRDDRYSELRSTQQKTSQKVEMSYIGG